MFSLPVEAHWPSYHFQLAYRGEVGVDGSAGVGRISLKSPPKIACNYAKNSKDITPARGATILGKLRYLNIRDINIC